MKASIDMDITIHDLEDYNDDDVFEFYENLMECEQVNFLRQVFKKEHINEIIKELFVKLENDEQDELLKEFESNFISDEKVRQSLEYLRFNA